MLVLIRIERLPALPLTAPIHYQLRSRDVLACFSGQKHDSVSNIVSFSKHTKWNALCDLFRHTLLNNQAINALGSFYRARGNPVATNSLPPPFHSQRFHQILDACFGRSGVRSCRPAEVGSSGADGNDTATVTGILQMR